MPTQADIQSFSPGTWKRHVSPRMRLLLDSRHSPSHATGVPSVRPLVRRAGLTSSSCRRKGTLVRMPGVGEFLHRRAAEDEHRVTCRLSKFPASRRPLRAARRARPIESAVRDAIRRGRTTEAPAKENHEAAKPIGPLPARRRRANSLDLPGRTLHFTAKAGAVNLSAAQTSAPLADVAYVAFLRDDADTAKRPITFAINGGPGAGSAWLDLGGLGPRRLPLDGGAVPPSADPRTVPNAETWLDFTDLVFIDPPGTGYSRISTREHRPNGISIRSTATSPRSPS